MNTTKRTLITTLSGILLTANALAQTVLIDFGSASTFRGVTPASPDTNGNHWNSTAFGFIGNLVDSTGVATSIDWTPDGIGGVDSFNSLIGATTNPVTAGEIAAAQTLLDGGSVGIFGIAEVAMDFYVSNNGTSNLGRFQIQQVAEGQEYDLTFYGARQFTGIDTQTTYSVFSDSSYTTLLDSVTLTHGDGGSNGNISNVATISGLVGPSNLNNIFYVQWEGTVDSTKGYINAMSITAIPEPSTFMLFGLSGVACIALLRRRK